MMKSVTEDYEPFPLHTVNQSSINTLVGVFSNCSLMPGSKGAGQQDGGVGMGMEMGMGADSSLHCSLPAPGPPACS